MMHPSRSGLLALSAATCLLVLLAPTAQAGEPGEEPRCNEPVDHCVRVMVENLEHRGWVGIEMEHAEDQPYMIITRVIADSPAAAAGLRSGDALIEFNGIPYLEENQQKVKAVYKKEMTAGNTITYTIFRDGHHRAVKIHLAPIPDSVRAQWVGHHVLHYHEVALPPKVADREEKP